MKIVTSLVTIAMAIILATATHKSEADTLVQIPTHDVSA